MPDFDFPVRRLTLEGNSGDSTADLEEGPMNNKQAEELLRRAYELDGANPDETRALYRDWAETYDGTMLDGLGYVSPKKIAALAALLLPDKAAPVLDVGCGTGLLAAYLAEQGFTHIDGLDYSAEMLDVAEKKGRIKQRFLKDLNQPLNMQAETYAALTSTGTFTHGHVGGACLPGLLELLKPGGLLICTVHQDVWDEGGFGDALDALVVAHSAEIVSRDPDRLFESDDQPTGWYLVVRRI
ncbi:MAG: class I SAM-dependent DNA methyltransferase [Alphaproteobacteria bacterium]